MIVRPARNAAEVDLVYAIEERSYPPEAAATRDAFHKRRLTFGDYFLVAEAEDGSLAGVANGVRLGHDRLEDEGMKQMASYDPEGRFFCLLTVAVDPAYRGKGIGRSLVSSVVKQAASDRLEAVILMCEEHLIRFYEELGFTYLRPSVSTHGGMAWHEMKLQLAPVTGASFSPG
ncbi:GNAT family N-acetyltransferase [Paenibacillus sp. P26]|nr:GNAT family N-acetyltransferase [Paenibacillus sp. P26]UUZ93885.1 GNAT family N-acetyltransferase [Paenibacillus sp. P25]